MIEDKRIKALGKLQGSSKKRLKSEERRLIERENDRLKKRNQRVVKYTPYRKKEKRSGEVNVFAKSGLSRRQRTNGQDGCSQLACSTLVAPIGG